MRHRVKKEVSMPTREQIRSERNRIHQKRRYKKTLFSTIRILLSVAAIAVLITSLFLPVLQITGDSMMPTLANDNIVVLVKKKSFKSGDVCSFTWNNRTLIKRVIGVPGDWIEIKEDGTVYLNNRKLNEPYVTEKSLGECDLTFPYQVPENSLFLMGDHRETSIDSRSSIVGSVHYDQVIGRVVFRVWPLKEFGVIH